MIRLRDITDTEEFANDIIDGYIGISQNPCDERYLILCYKDKCYYKKYWKDLTTRLARGLIIKVSDYNSTVVSNIMARVDIYNNLTGEQKESDDAVKYRKALLFDMMNLLSWSEVVSRGLNKFFTVDNKVRDDYLSLVDDDEGITIKENVDIDFSGKVSVSDKLDGSLGIGYIMDDKMCLSTKSSFVSNEALAGTNFLLNLHDGNRFCKLMKEELEGFTPLFEIISDYETHIINYDGMNDIVFLGLIHNLSGRWIPVAMLGKDDYTKDTVAKDIPDLFNFKVPIEYDIDNFIDAVNISPKVNHEGVVITVYREDGSQEMYKVKYNTFLSISAAKDEMAMKTARHLIRNRYTPNDLMNHKKLSDYLGISKDWMNSNYDVYIDIKDKFDYEADKRYINPMIDMATEATKIFLNLAPKYDLTTKTGQKLYAIDVMEMEDIDKDVKTILLSMKSGVYQLALQKAKDRVVKPG